MPLLHTQCRGARGGPCQGCRGEAGLSLAGSLVPGGQGPWFPAPPGPGLDALCSHRGLCPGYPSEKTEPALVTEHLCSPSQEGLSRLLDLAPHTSRPVLPQGRPSGGVLGSRVLSSPLRVPPPCSAPDASGTSSPSPPRNQVWTHLQQRKPGLREGWSRQSGAGEAPPNPTPQDNLPWS